MILITGGAGFIGSNFVRSWLAHSNETIINVDKLTYAGNLQSLADVVHDPRHRFVKGCITDGQLIFSLLQQHKPRVVIHFAAESHVDKSISSPGEFIQTNVVGTYELLEASRSYYTELSDAQKAVFRFIHVSTDEVFGSLQPEQAAFSETSGYFPNSAYSASKASSDHLVRAWHKTYGLPTMTTHCSNNYGPYQFPEKLIPLVISKAMAGQPLPVYGDGQQIRDWLYVDDHCQAIQSVLKLGRVGEKYNIGGNNEVKNLDLVHSICSQLDDLKPRADKCSYSEQIAFVSDRPGHDTRYAIDASKISRDLDWSPLESVETGLAKTVQWYLHNREWLNSIASGEYLRQTSAILEQSPRRQANVQEESANE